MYGMQPIQLEATDQDAACDGCGNKNISLFTLADFCKAYEDRFCVFSELAKEKVRICKECIFNLRSNKMFQLKSSNAQKTMEAQLTIICNEHGQFMQRTLAQLILETPCPIREVPTDPVEYQRLLRSSLLGHS